LCFNHITYKYVTIQKQNLTLKCIYISILFLHLLIQFQIVTLITSYVILTYLNIHISIYIYHISYTGTLQIYYIYIYLYKYMTYTGCEKCPMHTDMQYIQDDLCKSLLSSASGLMSSLKEVVISSSWFMKLLKSEKFVDVLFEPCNS
jgi:hypothetical protein